MRSFLFSPNIIWHKGGRGGLNIKDSLRDTNAGTSILLKWPLYKYILTVWPVLNLLRMDSVTLAKVPMNFHLSQKALNFLTNYSTTIRSTDNSISIVTYYILEGRAIAQAVSRWLPTAAARVQNRV
jgi:hypothetical protein